MAMTSNNGTFASDIWTLMTRTILFSSTVCFVIFRNCTKAEVDIIWIDFKGLPVVYGTLKPNQELKLKTYESHPWIFRDKLTHEKYQVNARDIFEAQSFQKIIKNSAHPIVGPVSPYFVKYCIHYPLYNLKERASQVVQRCLANPEEAYNLDIPETLKAFVAHTKFKHF